MAKIFKPLGVSLGASLEPRLSPCSSLLCLGELLMKPRWVDPIKLLRLLRLSEMVMNELFRSLINKTNTRYCNGIKTQQHKDQYVIYKACGNR